MSARVGYPLVSPLAPRATALPADVRRREAELFEAVLGAYRILAFDPAVKQSPEVRAWLEKNRPLLASLVKVAR